MEEQALESLEEKPDKDKGWKIARDCLKEGALYLCVFLATVFLFVIVKPFTNFYHVGAFAKTVISLVFAGCGVFIAYMGATKRLKARHILIVLLVAGYTLRVGYMLHTPASVRQQDTYSKRFNGHEAYAWSLFATGKLPTTNDYQFYHPPLNAMLQATFMKIVNGLTAGFNNSWFPDAFAYGKPDYVDNQRYFLYSSCQILAVLYSFITAVTMVKMLKLFNFGERTYLFLSAFVIFYPRHIQFAGMLNNDGISYMLGVIAMYHALKWQKGNKHIARIVFCGLAVGLGMMAKLSSATVCAPIAGIFIYEFIRALRKQEGALTFWKTFAQYALFLAICAPIGLWFQVYAKARFDQGFGFVFSNLNKKLYTGDHSFFTRFIFPLDLSEFFGSLYCIPFEGNYYLFAYALKSSIFGEFSYWQGEGFAVASLVFAYLSVVLLAISLTWAVIRCVQTRGEEGGLFKRAKLNFPDLLFVFLLVQSQVLSEIYFYIKMPYGCTMDFRYIMPLILGVGLLLGYTREVLAVEGGKFSTVMNRLTLISVVGFLTVSMLFYCTCI